MNTINAIHVEYLRPSRTIETILVSKEGYSKLYFLYNYEGYSFRLFNKMEEMTKFFNNEDSDFIEFEEEDEVDTFLENIELNSCMKKDEAILQALFSVPVSEFALNTQALFQDLKMIKGRAFSLPHIDFFLDEIDVKMLSATKKDKADIGLVVHDLYTAMQPQLGFSIKSMLGRDATLFNASKATNFIYELIGDGQLDTAVINKIIAAPKITNRINAIRQQGFKLQFVDNQSKMLKLNLQLIDGDLPKILAELLLIRYQQGISSISGLIQQLTLSNPLDYDLSEKHPFYAYKIKNFLTDAALGMGAARLWTGHYDATGGIIIVKENGDLVCYHIYNRNEFQTYLMDNTKHEQASTKKHGFGDVYEENGKYFIKLNLQIRFN